MAKLVYIENPSPLIKVSCLNIETGEALDVTTVPFGLSKELSCVPEKKGSYRMVLDFEFDPSVVKTLNSITISGSQQSDTDKLNIPGVTTTKSHDDGTITFQTKVDGENVSNIHVPGVNVVTKEDGSVSVSIQSPNPARRVTTIHREVHQEMPSISTMTTTTTTSVPLPCSNTEIKVGSLAIPRKQNINFKLPCPINQQDKVKAECTGPDGTEIEVKCSPVDDKTVNIEFPPSCGNGLYSVNYYIAEKIFPGCPIQMEIKGL